MNLFVKVHPKSRIARTVRSDESHFEIWVREAPDEGKANEAVLEALSDYLGRPKTSLVLKAGHRGRNKIIEMRG